MAPPSIIFCYFILFLSVPLPSSSEITEEPSAEPPLPVPTNECSRLCFHGCMEEAGHSKIVSLCYYPCESRCSSIAASLPPPAPKKNQHHLSKGDLGLVIGAGLVLIAIWVGVWYQRRSDRLRREEAQAREFEMRLDRLRLASLPRT